MLALCTVAAYALTQLFSGRGAFIHFGAMLGTIMAANVFFVIMPAQREMVKAKVEGRVPDPSYAARGKQRSVHNTYFTLPVLFVMISNHYALFTNAKHNWAILIAISLAGVFIRLYFTFKHRGVLKPSFWAIALGLLAAVFVALMPRDRGPVAGGAPRYAEIEPIVIARCAGCHADKPTFAGFAAAPKNVLLDTRERILAQAATIHQQTVVLKAMPIGNLTQMTDEERAKLDAWFRAGRKRTDAGAPALLRHRHAHARTSHPSGRGARRFSRTPGAAFVRRRPASLSIGMRTPRRRTGRRGRASRRGDRAAFVEGELSAHFSIGMRRLEAHPSGRGPRRSRRIDPVRRSCEGELSASLQHRHVARLRASPPRSPARSPRPRGA